MTTLHSRIFHDDYAVLFAAGAIGTLSDAELLSRFVQNRGDASAEAAFATLLDRHGPMVLGVCRRVTGDRHTADDAVQAVFIVLARKAHAVRLPRDDSLGRWLFGVSLRVARRARSRAKMPPAGATSLDDLDPIDPSSPSDTLEQADLRAAIDTEIARLPAHYRSAVVLCHLEGLSQKQAARRLRCPVGTVESRLNRARQRLRSGLARKGLAPSVGALAGILNQTSKAALPSDLLKATVRAAVTISSGHALTGSRRGPCFLAGKIHDEATAHEKMRDDRGPDGILCRGDLRRSRPRQYRRRSPAGRARADAPNVAVTAKAGARPIVPSRHWPKSSIRFGPTTRLPNEPFLNSIRDPRSPNRIVPGPPRFSPTTLPSHARSSPWRTPLPRIQQSATLCSGCFAKANAAATKDRMPVSSPWRQTGSSGTSATIPTPSASDSTSITC